MSGIGNGGPDDNDAQAGRLIAFLPTGGGAKGLSVEEDVAPGTGTGGTVAIANTGNLVAAPLTAGGHPNSNMPGRRKEDDENLVATGLVKRYGKGTDSDATDTLIAYPLARRGRDGGSELEVGEEGVYNALRAGDGGSSRLNQVMVGTAVRRLTPRECERLQGLPDDWTLIPEAKDSPRYAALGDAVTANVAEWLGGRLA